MHADTPSTAQDAAVRQDVWAALSNAETTRLSAGVVDALRADAHALLDRAARELERSVHGLQIGQHWHSDAETPPGVMELKPR